MNTHAAQIRVIDLTAFYVYYCDTTEEAVNIANMLAMVGSEYKILEI